MNTFEGPAEYPNAMEALLTEQAGFVIVRNCVDLENINPSCQEISFDQVVPDLAAQDKAHEVLQEWWEQHGVPQQTNPPYGMYKRYRIGYAKNTATLRHDAAVYGIASLEGEQDLSLKTTEFVQKAHPQARRIRLHPFYEKALKVVSPTPILSEAYLDQASKNEQFYDTRFILKAGNIALIAGLPRTTFHRVRCPRDVGGSYIKFSYTLR